MTRSLGQITTVCQKSAARGVQTLSLPKARRTRVSALPKSEVDEDELEEHPLRIHRDANQFESNKLIKHLFGSTVND